jgi:hypothetical protein
VQAHQLVARRHEHPVPLRRLLRVPAPKVALRHLQIARHSQREPLSLDAIGDGLDVTPPVAFQEVADQLVHTTDEVGSDLLVEVQGWHRREREPCKCAGDVHRPVDSPTERRGRALDRVSPEREAALLARVYLLPGAYQSDDDAPLRDPPSELDEVLGLAP